MLSGPSSSDSSTQSAVNLSVTHVLHTGVISDSHSVLESQLQAFWDLEAFGVNTLDTENRSVHSVLRLKRLHEMGCFWKALPDKDLGRCAKVAKSQSNGLPWPFL